MASRRYRVLIAPDKFKGSIDAQTAAVAMGRGWQEARPGDRIRLLPVSDGGDGFGALLSAILGVAKRQVCTVNAAHQRCRAHWWWHPQQRLAIVESARAIGLAMLPAGKFHPFQLDTRGLGLLLRKVAPFRPRATIVGIGGSATNDGGFGLARALGWQFLDRHQSPLVDWTALNQLAQIVPPADPLRWGTVIVATDVANPLLGRRGASRIYGPQKGLRPEDLPKAEQALHRLARVCRQTLGEDHSKRPGAGAAGGLGFALMAFLNAQPRSGIEVFAEYAQLSRAMRGVDLVLTGEGSIDLSSLMGKGVGWIAQHARQHRIPCVGICGCLGPHPKVKEAFCSLHALTPDFVSPTEAQQHAAVHLRRLTRAIALQWNQ